MEKPRTSSSTGRTDIERLSSMNGSIPNANTHPLTPRNFSPSTSATDDRKLLWKIDVRILPLLFCVFFLQFLDKVIYNYANVMNLQQDLHMTGNDYTWGATAFFIGYAVSELPQGFLLQHFPISNVLATNIFLWGLTTACSALTRTPIQLIALRTLLGCFESVVTPALIMLTSAWYQKDEAVPRVGFWFCGLGAGQIIGGLVSYAAQEAQSPNTKLSAWRIMFLCIGLVNVVVSAMTFFFLPSTPDEATWLTGEEKEIVAHRLIVDHAGLGIKKLRLSSIWETLGDVQIWMLSLLTIFSVSASGVIATYSAVLIKNFGYTGPQAALLNMPSGLVSIVGVMCGTVVIKLGYQRWMAIVCASLVTLAGACLMCFLPSTIHAGLLAGIYLVNGGIVVYPLLLSLASSNFRGYTRKLTAQALLACSFSTANIIGPQTFQAKDAPNFYPAKLALVITTGAAMAFAAGLRIIYGRRNKWADKMGEPAMGRWEAKAVRERAGSLDFGDKEYRYVY